MNNQEAKYHGIIAENIKKLRLQSRLSQEAMAEKLSCSREFISRVENKKEKISLSMLLKIASLFEINPSSMFTQS